MLDKTELTNAEAGEEIDEKLIPLLVPRLLPEEEEEEEEDDVPFPVLALLFFSFSSSSSSSLFVGAFSSSVSYTHLTLPTKA